MSLQSQIRAGFDAIIQKINSLGSNSPFVETDLASELMLTVSGGQFTLSGYFLDSVTSITAPNCTINIVSQDFRSLTADLQSGATAGDYDLTLVHAGGSVVLDGFLVADVNNQVPDSASWPWQNIVGEASVSLGQFEDTGVDSGWGSGASFGSIPANTDFVLEGTLDLTGISGNANGHIGVTDSDDNGQWYDTRHCINLYLGNYRVWEGSSQQGGNFGVIADGMVFKITRTAGVVSYSVNNDPAFFTSSNSYTGAMVADFAGGQNIRFNNISITIMN